MQNLVNTLIAIAGGYFISPLGMSWEPRQIYYWQQGALLSHHHSHSPAPQIFFFWQIRPGAEHPRGCKLFCICKMPMKLVERGCGKSFTLWNWFLCLGILLTSNYMGIWANINLNLLIRIFSITNQNFKKGFWHFHLFQISGGTIIFKLGWCNQPSRTCW